MELDRKLEGFAFQPGESHLAKSNVARFMKKYGISSYQELVKKANGDIAWSGTKSTTT